jgi:hypothetical protein
MTDADIEVVVDLPITPLGLAGVYLGEDVEAVVERVGTPLERRPVTQDEDEDAEFLEFGPFVVVGKAGIVDALWAIEGYRGRTIGGVGVGMPWVLLAERFPDVYFDDWRYAWRLPGWPYLDIEVSRPSTEEEAATEGPWTEEWYEITRPEESFISLIAVAIHERPEEREGASPS